MVKMEWMAEGFKTAALRSKAWIAPRILKFRNACRFLKRGPPGMQGARGPGAVVQFSDGDGRGDGV